MHFSITSDQRVFFEQNHYIEFEELIAPSQLVIIKQDADQALSQKSNMPVSRLSQENPLHLFQLGFQLHAIQKNLKKITHKVTFAQILSELTLQPIIRFGFDQYVRISEPFTAPFLKDLPLEQTSCLSPLAGAVIIPLEDLEKPLGFFPMPQRAGNILFISPNLPIPWSQLAEVKRLSFLLVGFALSKTFFKAETLDPLANELKKQGMGFNDFLKEPLYPLIKR